MIKKTIILFLLFAHQAHANQNFGYRMCNKHQFSFLFFNVYDSYLCLDDTRFLYPQTIYQTNFSLAINYNMNFSATQLAKSSIEEMNRYHDLSKDTQQHYFKQLLNIFPNVKKSDTIEARYNKKGVIEFYHNQALTGTITDATFSQNFLDIWLYKDHKYPDMINDLFKRWAQ